ncbi:MAG: S41 family peptidase [Myxococcales bacterium]|nr:hypothetical protein [Myxococcales bacterium]
MNRTLIALLLAGCASAAGSVGGSPELSPNDRGRVKLMLRSVSNDVKEHYYDPKFHGVDWDAAVAAAEAKIDVATTMGMAFSHVAAVLDLLGDSHTLFLAPLRRIRVDYGFRAYIVGDRCFVAHVRPGSDAEKKGVSPGDELFAINNDRIDRESLPKIEFVYNVLRPQLGLRLDLSHPGDQPIQLDVTAQTKEFMGGGRHGSVDLWDAIRELESEYRLNRTTFVQVAKGLGVLKIRDFSDVDERVLRWALRQVREQQALVLDLRGTPGGDIDNLKTLAALLFGRPVKLADLVYRDKTERLTTRERDDAFTGKLVVVVDSASASASEALARLVQIEGRGTVVGDATRGHVMHARHIQHDMRVRSDTVVWYGASVTDADIVMSDGKSLEHRGVQPDVRITPAVDDLVAGRDPVLARAIEMLGGTVTPEEAGLMFPFEWPSL